MDAIRKAEALIEALSYIRSLRDKLTVIKLGGSAMEDPDVLTATLQDVVFMATVGLRPIVVHGGGKPIDRAMAAAGLVPRKVHGRRFTDRPTLDIVVRVLTHEINAGIVNQINSLGGRAVGLHSLTFPVLFGKRLTLPGDDGKPVDLGYVGTVTRVGGELIESFCSGGVVPVIPSLALEEPDGGWLNVNADTAAAGVAVQLQAEKLVFLSDTPGILRDRSDPTSLIGNLNAAGCQELIARGIIDAGMIPKVEACLDGLRGGVRKTHMIDGRLRHSLLLEIYTHQGVGTQIVLSQPKARCFVMKQATLEQYKQFVIGNYTRYPVCLVRGEGSQVWDDEGKRYLDLFPGWGCSLLGHCPPRVVAAVREQVGRLIHVPNTWYTEEQGQLAEALSVRTTWKGQAFFCNSGTEANEAAIKLARLTGKPGRYKIVTMFNSFHGRTGSALSATGQPKYHQGVEPLLPGFTYVPFGDLDAVARAIDSETIAILLEPIQGEGGINLPPTGYLEGLRQLADRHHLLLIFDEVQTGMGRTGRWYAHQLWDVEPEIVTLAKALAGGVAMGGLLAKPEVADKLRPGTHAATFGGNPVACAAALATIETIEAEGLLDRAIQIGENFRTFFQGLQQRCPWIKEVRTQGCMIGVELTVDGALVVKACMERGLLVNCTHATVLRLLPAMNLTDSELQEGCAVLEGVLMNLEARG